MRCMTCREEKIDSDDTILLIVHHVSPNESHVDGFICTKCCNKIEGLDILKDGIKDQKTFDKALEFIRYKMMEQELLDS